LPPDKREEQTMTYPWEDEKTAATMAGKHPQLQQWLEANKGGFYGALGLRPFDDNAMVLVLAEMHEYFGGRFSLYKNDTGRYRCDIVQNFLRGEKVDENELRTAMALFIQSYNAAMDRLHEMERRRIKERITPRVPRPFPRRG